MNWIFLQQLLRIALNFVAGTLVSRGFLDDASSTIVTGAVLSLASWVWWISTARPEMSWDSLQQGLRHLFQIVAGLLVGSGLMTSEMADTASGALLSLASVVWWLFWARKATAR